MAILQIHLEEELQQRVAARATDCGFKSIEAYVQSVLTIDAEQEFPNEDLEQLLLQRLDSPSIEVTPELIAKFKEEITQRRHLIENAK